MKAEQQSDLEILMEDVDLGKPFLDHVYLGCTQRECQISKDIVDDYRSMFEPRISAGATEKETETKANEKLDAETVSSWSYDMEGHAKNTWKDIASSRIKQLSRYTKSQLHAWMTINLKKKKQNQLESCQIHAHKLFWNVYWHVLAGLIFYGPWTDLLVLSLNGPEHETTA